MTTKGLFLGAILLIIAITSTLSIFTLYLNHKELKIEVKNQAIDP